MSLIQTYHPEQLSDCQRIALIDLFWLTWPGEESYEEAMAQFNPSKQRETDRKFDVMRFMIWDGDLAVAHTAIFTREVHTEQGAIRVGALSGVCTHREYQGRGYGAATVRGAFGLVDQGVYPVSLWMTMVTGFYEKLGARIIHNTWVNQKNMENPTADPWPHEIKMIYPANYPWPQGVIDLNGNPY